MAAPVPAAGRGRALRSIRAGRGPGPDPRQGDMVIDALVRARLLGLQLLTLEARVVVGTEEGPATVVIHPLAYSSSGTPGVSAGQRELSMAGDRPGPGLARAVELVDEGAHTLERSRRHAATIGRTAAR